MFDNFSYMSHGKSADETIEEEKPKTEVKLNESKKKSNKNVNESSKVSDEEKITIHE